MSKIWKVLDSRAVVPVEVVSVSLFKNGKAHGETKSGRLVFGFPTKDEAVARSRRLIERSETQAKAQLLNCQKHRLRLEQSVKEYAE